MRRVTLLAALLLGLAGWLAAAATGEDTRTYEIEFDNAFGLTTGGDLRIAGVNAGTITDVGISPEKRALVTVELSGPLAVLGEETTCSAEPQSLIAEYFIDCLPAGEPLEDRSRIPVAQTRQTVQADLFQNTTREPFRDRLRLLVNEFGTGLAGNGKRLNEAIRRGAPALGNLREALRILAAERRTIRRLNSEGEAIVSRLAERSGDVERFISSSRRAAVASADRREELSRDIELLDDFVRELRPTLGELSGVASRGEPLFANLGRAGAGLERLGRDFPAFAAAGGRSLQALGAASEVGRRAVLKSADEVELVRQGSRKLAPTFAPLTDFLRDLADPRRVVETDDRARRKCDDATRSCWATGREGPTGYTAIEGLLNYAYYLAGATNQYDDGGHLLHFSFYDLGEGPCGPGRAPGEPGTEEFGVPAADGGFTTEILEAHPCVSWLGPNQPGINEDLSLPPYDPSVCPQGSNAPELCDPDGAAEGSRRSPGPTPKSQPAGPRKRDGGSRRPADPGGGKRPGDALGDALPGLPGLPGVPGLPDLPGLRGERAELRPGVPSSTVANDLLRFLLG